MLKSMIIGLGVASAFGVANAHARHSRRHLAVYAQPVPSVDAVALSALAPPTLYATATQTYGDSAFARARSERREEHADTTMPVDRHLIPFGIDPCEPRAAGPDGYRCLGDPTQPGYGQYYSYLPANASAPQVPRYDPDAQSAILAPVTGLFWAVNAARLDPHN